MIIVVFVVVILVALYYIAIIRTPSDDGWLCCVWRKFDILGVHASRWFINIGGGGGELDSEDGSITVGSQHRVKHNPPQSKNNTEKEAREWERERDSESTNFINWQLIGCHGSLQYTRIANTYVYEIAWIMMMIMMTLYVRSTPSSEY